MFVGGLGLHRTPPVRSANELKSHGPYGLQQGARYKFFFCNKGVPPARTPPVRRFIRPVP